MIYNRLIVLLGLLVCFIVNLNAIERADSTTCPEEHFPSKELDIHKLLADVPSGDPDLYSYDSYDGKMPQWVLGRINSCQAELIKEYSKNSNGLNYTALRSILGDSVVTKKYFEKFRSDVSGSSRNEGNRSFQAWLKANQITSSSVSAGFPMYRLEYPMARSVEGCQLCSYPVYSPVNGDDIHLMLDVVFMHGQKGEYKIVGQYLYLTGSLSENAVWASEVGTKPVSLEPWDEKGYGMFPGSVFGYISYYKDGKPKQVEVNLLLSISPK